MESGAWGPGNTTGTSRVHRTGRWSPGVRRRKSAGSGRPLHPSAPRPSGGDGVLWLWDQPLPQLSRLQHKPLLPGITKSKPQIYHWGVERGRPNKIWRAPTRDTNARRQREPQTPAPQHRSRIHPRRLCRALCVAFPRPDSSMVCAAEETEAEAMQRVLSTRPSSQPR